MKRNELIGKKKITNTKDLLIDIINSPKNYLDNDVIIKALKSQSELSKYCIVDKDDRKSISSCSINTLKTYANEYFDGGFKVFDELRVSAKSQIANCKLKTSKNKKTHIGMNYQLEKYKSENKSLKIVNINQQIIIEDLRSSLKEMASSENSTLKRLEEYNRINHIINLKLSKLIHIKQVN
ncbi:hypothetical protein BA894_23490 [Vibrio natriegens]|uniref:hypothetical protein n=1 Tax=Vibrio natriegens TaxID=691 RepID=UPI000803DE9C|nr:hypothetical protein [Vibrio natriegens]ANQ29346.1 hypothetical protein BA894_23490 [Vibrio natriegens]